MTAQRRECLLLQSCHLQLDIKERPTGKSAQDIFQRGQEKVFRRGSGNLQPIESRVMANHGLLVGRAPHVKFKPVAAMLQTKFERRQSILRNAPQSPGSAMPEQKRSSHLRFHFSRFTRRLGGEETRELSLNRNPEAAFPCREFLWPSLPPPGI